MTQFPMYTRSGNVTIADVAIAAGVSSSTASRAFNHPGLLKEETVARVKQAADELGFRHNRYAKALSTGRSSTLALIVPDLSNPFFPPLVQAAQVSAEEAGYDLYILSSEHSLAREKHLADRVAGDVAGLILASPRMTQAEIREIAKRTPLVLINAKVAGVSSVLVSAAAAITQAIAQSAAGGSSTVSYIGGSRRSWANGERESSTRREAERYGLPYRHVILDEPSYDAARAYVAASERIADELVVAFDDIVAHGILDGMRDQGFTAPSDFRILGCDDALPINTSPALSTVLLDTRLAARLALELLLSNVAGAQQLTVSGSYRPGETI